MSIENADREGNEGDVLEAAAEDMIKDAQRLREGFDQLQNVKLSRGTSTE